MICLVCCTVCGQSALPEACVSDASSDAVSLSAVKDLMVAVTKSEDCLSCIREADDEEKFAGVSVKVEPKECSSSNCRAAAENEASVSCVKVKSEDLSPEDGTVVLTIKVEELESEDMNKKQLPADDAASNTNSNKDAETGVETTEQLHSDASNSANMIQPDQLQETNKPQQVCSKTDVHSTSENDCCKAVAETATINVANVNTRQRTDDGSAETVSDAVAETPCQQVSSEKSGGGSLTAAAGSEHGDQEQSVESTIDLTAATLLKCSSPQRSKKLANKQGNPTSSDSPGM